MEPFSYSIKIKDLPEKMRPRERLFSEGAESLSNSDLLAILLRTGTADISAVELASFLLGSTGGLTGLMESSVHELCDIKGMGMAKAAQIKAALELGKRLSAESFGPKKVIKTPLDVHNLLKDKMRYYDREYFKAILLDTKHQVIAVDIISIGSLDASLVHPREVFKSSIKKSAAAVILAHNHPSGDPTPSDEDMEVTRRLSKAGEIIGIQILDHLIFGRNNFVSLKELGMF